DCMNECLWREVEALTVAVALNRPDSNPPSVERSQRQRTVSMSPSVATVATGSSSSSSGSSTHSTAAGVNPTIDQIKQSIAKQKQSRRTTSNQRLSQITSSLSSSYASAQSAPVRVSTSSPEDIIRQRRVSTTLCFTTGSSPSQSVFTS